MIGTYTRASGGVQRRAEKRSAAGNLLLGLLLLPAGCGGPGAGVPGPAPVDPSPPDDPLAQATGALLERLVAIDTGTAPIKERPAALVLADALTRAGLEAGVVEDPSGRASVFARLRGGGGGRPLLLLSHLDTHPFDAALWAQGPTSGVVEDGTLWGRGSNDGKALAALHATALIALSQGPRPERDILLVAAADGVRGQGTGLARVIAAHPEVATAELALTKGGGGFVDLLGDGRVVHGIAYAERGWARIEVAALSGAPDVPSPKARLIAALDRALVAAPRSTLTEPIEALWSSAAADQAWPLRVAAGSHLLTKLFLIEGWSQRPETRGLVLDELRIERVEIGVDRARGILEGRALPGTKLADLVAGVRARTANDSVHVQILAGAEANQSPIDGGLLARFSEAIGPEAGEVVAPILAAEPTDGHHLRAIGVPTYGFLPLPLDRAAIASVRGRDERVALADLGQGARRMIALLKVLTAAGPDHSTR